MLLLISSVKLVTGVALLPLAGQWVLGLLAVARKAEDKYVGICDQGPSDHPDFAVWLADEGIASISLNPDSVIETWKQLAQRG
jgi:pyruvate,water dikinase